MDGHTGGGEDLEYFAVEERGNGAEGTSLISLEWGMGNSVEGMHSPHWMESLP